MSKMLSLVFSALFALPATAQVVEVRVAPSVSVAPVPSLFVPTALQPALSAPSLVSPNASLTPLPVPSALTPVSPAAAVPEALNPLPAQPSATMALTDFAANPAAIRAFLDSHPSGGRIDASRFQELVERVFLSIPGRRGVESLPALRETAGESGDADELALVDLLSDLPRVTAEGIVRSFVFAPSRRELDARQKGWAKDGQGRPIADVVVVGAGPAGLSAGLHAAHEGLKTVVFEAGYAAQSFSDAGMKAVYRMRTPTPRNSLVQAPFSPPELVAELSMAAKLPAYRAAGQAAGDALYARTRMAPIGGARKGLDTNDPAVASARDELLQHFSDVSAEINRRGGVLAELSPVESIVKDADGLWTVTVNGRVQRARKLVLAQGQVGTQLQNVRVPLDLTTALRDAGERPLVLRDRRDLRNLNGQLAGLGGRRLVVSDALLGAPEIEREFRVLRGGARVMIVGSGESAVKAAVAVLRANPRLKVDLFVKDHLQPAQLQIPPAHAAPDAIAAALKDLDAAARTLTEWEAFGTPVTPATLADLDALQGAGRLRIIELGKKCIAAACDMGGDPNHTIEVAAIDRGGRTRLRVYASDPEVIERLKSRGIGSREAKTGRWLISEVDGPIVSAVGYDRAALRRDPLTRALVETGLLVPMNGQTKTTANEFAMSRGNPLVSAGDPDLYFAGAQNTAMSADSAIPGGVARAAAVVADIRRALALPPGPGKVRSVMDMLARRARKLFTGR